MSAPRPVHGPAVVAGALPLLVACAPQRTDALLRIIVEAGYPAASRIGHVEEGPAAIRVVG